MPQSAVIALVTDTLADEFCIPEYRHLLVTDPTSGYGLALYVDGLVPVSLKYHKSLNF